MLRISLLVLAFLLTSQAQAKVSQKTSYSYFKVHGKTSREIYASLLKHAKGPGGHDAYATTTTRISQKTNLKIGKNCSISDYQLFASFKINLPKLASKASPAALQGWNDFAGVLKRHEEHHRDLWLACVYAFEQQVRNLQSKSCASLTATFKKKWKSMEKTCTAQNNAFDKQEQQNFLRNPFIQMVLRGR